MADVGHHFRHLCLTAQHFEERLAVTLQLACADAADPGHFRQGARLAAEHFQQGGVGENDIGRHAMFFRQFAPQGAQGFPLFALFATYQLAGLAGAALGGSLRLYVTAQLQGHLALEQRPAAVAQTQAAITVQIDVGQATSHQLAEQRAPFAFATGLAHAEYGKMLMAEAADFFRVLPSSTSTRWPTP